MNSWSAVQLSRHPQRPYFLDYVTYGVTSFLPLHGDRAFGEDPSLVGGLATLPGGTKVMLMGHQKGRGTKEKIQRSFGMSRPEGYRKAIRLMQLAERWSLPVVTIIDTPGAYPGIDAEERGQAQAIAEALTVSSRLATPIVATVIGEGGSGGALALGVADRVLMLQHSTYSVISPEACASILWSDSSRAEQAANALKMGAEDVASLPGLIDQIVPEPGEGAHTDPQGTAALMWRAIESQLEPLIQLCQTKGHQSLLEERGQRLRQLGNFSLISGDANA